MMNNDNNLEETKITKLTMKTVSLKNLNSSVFNDIIMPFIPTAVKKPPFFGMLN